MTTSMTRIVNKKITHWVDATAGGLLVAEGIIPQ